MNSLILISGLRSVAEKCLYFVLPLWAYAIAEDHEFMSIVRVFEYLPYLVFGFLVGAIVDILGSRTAFIAASLGQAAFLIILVLFGEMNYNLLIACVFMVMGFTYFSNNALIVQTKHQVNADKLVRVNKYTGLVANAVDSSGPLIIGSLLLHFTYKDLLHGSYALVIASLLLGLIYFKKNEISARKNLVESVFNGFRELYKLKDLWVLTWWTSIVNGVVILSEVLIIFYSKSILSLSDFEIGLLFAAAGLGAITGSYFSEAIEKMFGFAKVLLGSSFLMGVCYFALYLNISLYSMTIVLFLESFLMSLYIVCIRSYRIVVCPVEYLGTISGATGSIFKICIPIALITYGFIGTFVSVSNIFLSLAVIFILCPMLLAGTGAVNIKQTLSDNY